MTYSDTVLAHVEKSTELLLAGSSRLDPAAVAGPSALPGWTRAHVLTHLARHADAVRRVTTAALAERLVDPYPGGPAGRRAEIDEGAQRDAATIVADLGRSVAALSEVWREVPEAAWQRPTRALNGTRPLHAGLVARWVEVEVHHVDLDVGRRPADWPAAFVGAALPYVMAGLPTRVRPDQAEPLPAGWLLRCADIGTGWHVDTGTGHAVVHEVGATAPPGDDVHVVDGIGAAVLAWLLGRSAGDDLRVRPAAAGCAPLRLPAVFPFP